MHAERLPRTERVPYSVFIAQVVFLLERGHTDTTMTLPSHCANAEDCTISSLLIETIVDRVQNTNKSY